MTESLKFKEGLRIFTTTEQYADAKPMPLPAVGNVPFSSQIESAPSSQVSATGGPPTLSAALRSTQLFTPVPRQEDSVVPEMFGSEGFRFTSSRLVTDAVANLGGERTCPYSITGQLTFTIPPGTTQPPGNYVCSATVQRLGVITTAGHCVSDGSGHFYKNGYSHPRPDWGVPRLGSGTGDKLSLRTPGIMAAVVYLTSKTSR